MNWNNCRICGIVKFCEHLNKECLVTDNTGAG